jgi:hypothetical protein
LTSADTTVDESVALEVTIENDGSGEGTETFSVTLDGRTVIEHTVTIAPDTTRTITVTFTVDEPGEFAVAADGESAGVLVVNGEQTEIPPAKQGEGGQADQNGAPTSELGGFDPLTIVTIIATLGVIAFLFALVRRRV